VAHWDTSRYLALFVAEGTEHLDALGKELVRLEQQGPTPEAMDSLFRHAHSVKGMSGSMGYDVVAALAHRLEDLLDALRASPARLEKALIDLMLQAVDALTAQVQATSRGLPPPEAGPLAVALTQAAGRVAAPSAVPEPPPPAPPTPEAPAPTAEATPPGPSLPPRFALTLRVSPAASQPGVRGFLATRRLGTLGNVFNLAPPLEDIKSGRLPRGLITLELETDEHEDAVRKTVAAVADVELESLRAVGPQGPPPPAPDGPRPVGQEPARTVRIRTELLDDFLDAAGELLLATARVREVGKQLPEAHRPVLEEPVDRLHALARALHDKVMQARMTPMSVITDRLPRAARDIAQRRGREVELVVAGGDIELDRAIVDELGDAVLHVLRNAIRRAPHARQAAARGGARRGAPATRPRGARGARRRPRAGHRAPQGAGRRARAGVARRGARDERARGAAAVHPARAVHRGHRHRHLRARRGHGRGEARGGGRRRRAGARVDAGARRGGAAVAAAHRGHGEPAARGRG
jgi:two-component system chemotaxis sensor kinase CheA